MYVLDDDNYDDDSIPVLAQNMGTYANDNAIKVKRHGSDTLIKIGFIAVVLLGMIALSMTGIFVKTISEDGQSTGGSAAEDDNLWTNRAYQLNHYGGIINIEGSNVTISSSDSVSYNDGYIVVGATTSSYYSSTHTTSYYDVEKITYVKVNY